MGLKCVTQLSCAMGLSCVASGAGLALRRARAAGLAYAVMLRRAVGCQARAAGLAYAVMLRLRRAWAADCRRSPGLLARKR